MSDEIGALRASQGLLTTNESDQATGTACNGCGDCCDPVVTNYTLDQLEARIARGKTVGEDPESLAVLEANLAFAREHWEEIDADGSEVYFECSAFDRLTRLCTAHDSRPPVCEGYPWYGRKRKQIDALTAVMLHRYDRCEFWADVPPERRPEGWKPVLLTTKPRE